MRCVIIDDTPIFLMGLRSLLESFFPSWEISTAGSLNEGIRSIYETPRDRLGIVVLDHHLCAERDSGFVPRIRAMTAPHPVGIVLLGNAVQRNESLRELWGVNAFVDRRSSLDEIVQIVASVGTQCAKSSSPKCLPFVCPPVSNRHRAVLQLLKQGCSNKRIASTLQLTCGTVKNYMVTLMRQFNVRSRLELVAKLNDVSLQSKETSFSPEPLAKKIKQIGIVGLQPLPAESRTEA